MRATLLALTVGLLSLAGVSNLQAQTQVAVVDMGAVFNAHPEFKQRVDALKAEVERFDAVQKQEREKLVAEAQGLQGQDAASPAFRQSESNLANRSANLDVQKRLMAKEFAQKEAQIYYDVYRDVSAKVRAFSEQNQLSMVIHFNSKEMDNTDPTTIMGRMNSNVIYHRGNANITSTIIQLCGGRQESGNASGFPQK